MIPAGLPERSFVAKFPSVATSFGSISSICRKRCGSHAAISSGSGSRFPGGRHLRTFATKTSARVSPMPVEQLVEQLSRLPDERDALLVLVEPRRLAHEHEVGVRAPGAEHDLRAALRERAPRAGRRLLRVLPERRCALDGIHRDVSLRRARMRSSVPRALSGRSRRSRRSNRRQPPDGPVNAGFDGAPCNGERRELLQDVPGAALGAGDRLVARADELLEVRLALHARVLVDRHEPSVLSERWRSGAAPTLEGRIVRLEPLRAEHEEGLWVASRDPRTWRGSASCSRRRARSGSAWSAQALAAAEAGTEIPLVTIRARGGRRLDALPRAPPRARSVEIGWTWLHPSAWGTGANVEAKLLQLAARVRASGDAGASSSRRTR